MNGSELIIILIIISVFWSLLKKGIGNPVTDNNTNPKKDKDILAESGFIDNDSAFTISESEIIPVDEAVLESEAEEHFEETPEKDFQFHAASYHPETDETSITRETLHPQSEDLSSHGIRQAIIMAEILSPPLSNRRKAHFHHKN